jgi:hypothetical protein
MYGEGAVLEFGKGGFMKSLETESGICAKFFPRSRYGGLPNISRQCHEILAP